MSFKDALKNAKKKAPKGKAKGKAGKKGGKPIEAVKGEGQAPSPADFAGGGNMPFAAKKRPDEEE